MDRHNFAPYFKLTWKPFPWLLDNLHPTICFSQSRAKVTQSPLSGMAQVRLSSLHRSLDCLMDGQYRFAKEHGQYATSVSDLFRKFMSIRNWPFHQLDTCTFGIISMAINPPRLRIMNTDYIKTQIQTLRWKVSFYHLKNGGALYTSPYRLNNSEPINDW